MDCSQCPRLEQYATMLRAWVDREEHRTDRVYISDLRNAIEWFLLKVREDP